MTHSSAMASFATGGYARGLQTPEMMHKIDTDSDGTVSHDEFIAYQMKVFEHDGQEQQGFHRTAGVSRQVRALPAGCCSRSGSPRARALAWGRRAAAGDWTQFGWDVASSGASTDPTGITPANAASLQRHQVALDGTVDAAAIYLHGIEVKGAPHDVFFVTTTYGKTIAIDADQGSVLWEYTPLKFADLGGLAPDHQQHPGGRSRPQSHLCRRARRHDSKARRRGRARALDDAHHPTAGAREDRLAPARISRPHHRSDHGLHRGQRRRTRATSPFSTRRAADSCTSGTHFAATKRDCSCRAPAPPRNPAFGAAPAR